MCHEKEKYMAAPWNQRFLGSTRGRLIALLRRDVHTVDELATLLQLTDNAVRLHLATLERDGLVRQLGVRRGVGSGKPAYTYGLTDEAEQLFPKPYDVILDELLVALQDKMSPNLVETLLRTSGSRLADQCPTAEGDLRARLESAATALNQLGGLAEVEESDGQLAIKGYSCPLAALVPAHPEICRLAETFVSDVAGVPLHECCDRGSSPHCCFTPVAS
jgi:predicted ArsR family transcriptional regulator